MHIVQNLEQLILHITFHELPKLKEMEIGLEFFIGVFIFF